MKAVLISIRPKWCEKICHVIGKEEAGKPIYEKRIEVRKTAPKEVPFKAYIYETKESKMRYLNDRFNSFLNNKSHYTDMGKVIGEFICDKAERFSVGSLRSDDIEKLACLSYNEMINYFYKPEELDGKTVKQGFAWHISDLKIYGEPKELSEFKTPPCEKSEKACEQCKYLVVINTPDMYEVDCFVENGREISRPPQSWCYVEER
jgi:predicted transcriptional regulator